MRYRFHHLLASVLLLSAGASACRNRIPPPSGQCVFDSDCSGGQVCASHACRTRCTMDSECSNVAPTAVCIVSPDTPSQNVCVVPMSQEQLCTYDSDCRDPALVCGPTARCQALCAVPRDCQLFSPNFDCVSGRCAAVSPDGGGADSSPDASNSDSAAPTG